MTYLRTGLSLTTALTLSVFSLSLPAFAQEGTGVRGTLSFGQGIESEDGDVATRTSLGFGVLSETRAQTFRFNIDTELFGDFSSGAARTFDLRNKNASLFYRTGAKSSNLSFTARFSEVNLADQIGTDDTDTRIVIDSGTRENTTLGVTYALGVDGPASLELSARTVDTKYFDTTDPDLEDQTTTTLDALARFRINPAVTGRVRAGLTRTDEDDATATERETTFVGVGVEARNGSGLTVTGDLLFDRAETTVTGPVTTTNDGIGAEVSVSQELRDGSIGFTLSSRVDDTGRRSAAEVSRSFELPTGGLSLSLGVIDQEGDDSLRVTGGLQYQRDTKAGGLTAALTQETSSNDGIASLNTKLNVDYTQELSPISSFTAGVGYAATNELNGPDDDSRTTARLEYNRNLTRDWQMNTGIEYSKDDGASSSNTLFLNVKRDITFGF